MSSTNNHEIDLYLKAINLLHGFKISPENEIMALDILRVSSEKGFVPSTLELALYYEKKGDAEESFKWFEITASQCEHYPDQHFFGKTSLSNNLNLNIKILVWHHLGRHFLKKTPLNYENLTQSKKWFSKCSAINPQKKNLLSRESFKKIKSATAQLSEIRKRTPLKDSKAPDDDDDSSEPINAPVHIKHLIFNYHELLTGAKAFNRSISLRKFLFCLLAVLILGVVFCIHPIHLKQLIAKQLFGATHPRLTQKIVFPHIAPPTKPGTYPMMRFKSTAGLPVIISIVSGPMQINDDTYTITGSGKIEVVVTQDGNNEYEPAPTLHASFSIPEVK